MTTPLNPTNAWVEAPPSGVDLPVPAFLQFDGTDWIIATSGSHDGRLIADENGDYVIVDLRTPTLIVDSGGDYGLNTSGTPVAQLVDDDGDVTLDTTLTEPVVAVFGQDLAGNIVMVRNEGQPELQLLSIGGSYIGHEVL